MNTAPKSAIALSATLLVLMGCGAKVLEVEPAALLEVRGIGAVIEETTVDPIYENTVQVINLLIMDVDASSFEEASAKASDLLQARGWFVSDRYLDYVEMESAKWDFTKVTIGPLSDLDGYGATMKNGIPPESAAYVLVDVTPVGP
jgi:hypothetical protein